MTRGLSTQDVILKAFAARLRSEIGWATESTVFVTDQPVPPTLPSGRLACTVSAGDGAFPEEYQASAGASQLRELATVIVTPMVATNLDRPSRAEAKLLNTDVGLVRMKLDILRALCKDEWEPQDDQGEYLLAEPPKVSRSIGPADVHVGGTTMAAFRLVFNVQFNWDLR